MAQQVMTRETSELTPTPKTAQRDGLESDSATVGSSIAEPSIQDIIALARNQPALKRGVWLLSATTALLLWASFTPLDWGPLGWICLVPLILLIRIQRPTPWMYRIVYACGLLNTLTTLQWMRLGDPTMYVAWMALAVYLALYFPAFVSLSRVAVHRFGVPLTLAVPVAWVGLEYLRAHLMTGFSWYYLAHTQYRWIEVIQISDLFGAYGVSFLLAATAACLAGLVPVSLFERLRLLPAGFVDAGLNGPGIARRQVAAVLACLALFSAVLGYGYVRRSQADFRDGPRIALVQANFTASMKHDPRQEREIFNRHYELTGRAVRHQPDLIVWPETMYRRPLLEASDDVSDDELKRLVPHLDPKAWRSGGVRKALANLSQQAGAAMVIGVEAVVGDAAGMRRYNSAAFVRPDTGYSGRYDKLHRVLFGEYTPLKKELPWLHKFTPFPEDYGIAAGQSAAVFGYRGWRFSPLICFEDTVPHLVRRIVKSTITTGEDPKPIDCLINLTNDGWFHGSSELDQHLITAAFRSVECRTPMVRAVNTGISAVIDGDGVIREPDVFIDGDDEGRETMRDPKTGRWHKQLNAVLVDTIPLDNRSSLYVAWGDWFAASCSFGCLFIALGGWFRRGGG